MPDLGPFRLRFVQDTPVWVNADPARIERAAPRPRRFCSRSTAARLESDWGRFSDLIEWTCVQLRTTGPTDGVRARVACGLACARRPCARARQWLLGEYARLPHQKPVDAAADRSRTSGRRRTHLMHALERFPDDPQFQLSRVVAWTWGRDSEPIRNVRAVMTMTGAPVARAPQLEAIVDARAADVDRRRSRPKRGFASASCISPSAISPRRCARSKPPSRSPPSRR